MWGHISKPVSIISLLNVFRRFWLTVPSDNLNTGKSTLALKLRLKMYCLDLSDFFPLFPPNSIQKLQKKKSVSNGNELKKCTPLERIPIISAPHKDILRRGFNSPVQLNQR
jgi:hypothetical protein